MRSPRIATLLMLAGAALLPLMAEAKNPRELGRQGRVAILAAPEEEAIASGSAFVDSIRAKLESGSVRAASPGRVFLRVRQTADGSGHFEAEVYDYNAEAGELIRVDRTGLVLGSEPMEGQPVASRDEYAEARRIVKELGEFQASAPGGEVQTYEPMPPVWADEEGRRHINVGVIAVQEEGVADVHEIVSVRLGTGEVVRHADRSPKTAVAGRSVCGAPFQSCDAFTQQGPGNFVVEWPAESPVWRFQVTRPYFSSGRNGSGIELRDVRYMNRLVFKRAHVPIFNVEYENDICGPYRDWLYSEDCFKATGTVVVPGILVTDGTPPQTICESFSDQGNFAGIAIHEEGNSLWLVTEANAGWYRYVMQWRLHLDGTIEPIFGFSAVQDTCVCNLHFHHAYWRFEMALDGDPAVDASGFTAVDRWNVRNGGWTPVTAEGKFIRPASDPTSDRWRFRSLTSNLAFELRPGTTDGTANGDPFAKGDYWVLAYNAAQIDDGRWLGDGSDQTINIDGWINSEPIGSAKRTVFWYHADYSHVITQRRTGTGAYCAIVGPRFSLVGLNSPTPTPNRTPLPPDASIVLKVKLDSLSTDPDGGAVSYRYTWSSTGSDSTVTTGPTTATTSELAQGPGVTFDPGEVWTVRVVPIDSLGAEGAAREARFRIENDLSVIFEGWTVN